MAIQHFAVTPLDTRAALQFALELASDGQPLPPIGFLADLWLILAGRAQVRRAVKMSWAGVLPASIVRKFEDHVVSKLFADRTLERAANAIRPLKGRERLRAAAFIARQMRERVTFHGVSLSPAAIKSQLELSRSDIPGETGEITGLLTAQLEEMVATFRGAAELLGPEDVFELEHGTAIAEFGQRLALRQILQTVARWEAQLTSPPRRDRRRVREIPTRVADEDAYPVGGFASISNRGSIESLLHSQLAYMEPGAAARPDLFDVHYLRDELLYYSRDENQFFRQRRGFAFVLAGDLVDARFKDAGLSYQRIVLAQAWVITAVHKLLDWLDTEAVSITLAMPTAAGRSLLAAERELFDVIFREQAKSGVVRFVEYDLDGPSDSLTQQLPPGGGTKRLWVGTRSDHFAESSDQLLVAVMPKLQLGNASIEGEGTAEAAWQTTLMALLADWG